MTSFITTVARQVLSKLTEYTTPITSSLVSWVGQLVDYIQQTRFYQRCTRVVQWAIRTSSTIVSKLRSTVQRLWVSSRESAKTIPVGGQESPKSSGSQGSPLST